MKNPSDDPEGLDTLREDLIGLGERSLRKSYYPELQKRLGELERFKAFLDHGNDAIFLIEVPTGNIVDANDSSCRQLGWQREELLESSIFDVSDLGRDEKAKKLICTAGESVKERAMVEAVLHRREGEDFIGEITLGRMFFEESDSAYVIAVARDITKRKKAEEALAERTRLAELGAEVGSILTTSGPLELTLRHCAESLVRHTEAAFGRIWIVSSTDPNLLVLKGSAGLDTRIDGRHSRLRIGESKVGIVAKERKPYLTNSVIDDPLITDKEWVKREGMVAFAGYPLLVEDRLMGVVALFFKKPMTEAVLTAISSVANEIAVSLQRKRAEESLAQSEKQYQTLAEVSPVGIFYTRAEGAPLYVNEKWCEITGYAREKALKRELFWGLLPESPENILAAWKEAAEKEKSFVAEFLLNHPRGKKVWVVVRVMAERDARGGIIGYVGTFIDITDRKRAQMDLLKSEERRHKLQAEVEYAADVQRKLLPSIPPQVPGFDFAARCQPAYQVGGDFFDWQETGTGLLTLTLGDVMGKGMAAAMLMATVMASLRSLSQSHPPAMALQQAERALRGDLENSESFVTLFHSHLNIMKRTLTYVDCGHGYVFLLRSGYQVEELLPRGLPFGVLPGQGFQEGEVTLVPGDILILFSDGLVDLFQHLDLEDATLANQLWEGSAKEIVDRLFEHVPPEAEQPDDMTLLVVRCLEEA